MQKKLFLLLALLMLIITGCSIPPFNTEAALEYDLANMKYTAEAGKEIEIPVTNKNGVEADVKEVKIEITYNETKQSLTITKESTTGTVLTGKIGGRTTGKVVVSLAGITIQNNSEIKIVEVSFEDNNDNTVTLDSITKKIVVKATTTTDDTTETQIKAVEGLTAEVSGTTITLKWTQNSIATLGYIVYRTATPTTIYDSSNEEKVGTGTGKVTTSLTEYTDRDLLDGYTYFYKVTAYNGTTETPKQSIPVAKTVRQVIPPAVVIPAPTELVGESDTDSAVITWKAVSTSVEILGYNVYIVEKMGTLSEKAYRLSEYNRDTYTEEEKKQLPNVVKVSTFRLQKGMKYDNGTKELKTGVTYDIRVAAVRSDNGLEGTRSEAAQIYMYNGEAPVLEAGKEFAVVPHGHTSKEKSTTLGVELSWDDKDGVTEFIIERASSLDTAFEEIIRMPNNKPQDNFDTTGEQNWYVDGSFLQVPLQEYFYRIRCVTAEGIGRVSAAVTIRDYDGPAIPEITTKSFFLRPLKVDSDSIVTFDYPDLNKKIMAKGPDGKDTDIQATFQVEDDKGRIHTHLMYEGAVATVELDFAGYKVYMGNKHDEKLTLMAKTPYLGGLQLNVTKDIYGADTGFTTDGEYYIKVSRYDYFGYESGLSLTRDIYIEF